MHNIIAVFLGQILHGSPFWLIKRYISPKAFFSLFSPIWLTLLCSCSKIEGCIELPQGYRLWMASSKEKYITTEDDAYYLGPMIYSIGAHNDIIFGENAKVEDSSLQNVAGYFILAGHRGVYTGLSKSEYDRITKDVGVAEFDLKNGPSDLFKSGRYPECK